MDALQLSEVIRIGNAHSPEIFGAETSQALLGDGNADLLDAVDVRDFREDFFLFRIERVAAVNGFPFVLSETAHSQIGSLLGAQRLGAFPVKGLEGEHSLFGC